MRPATRPPRVLFVSGLQIHPTLSGGNLRSYALANALSRHGLDVRVHSLVGRKPDYLARRSSDVQRWPEGVLEYVDRGWTGFVAQFGSYAAGLPPLWLAAYLHAGVRAPRERLLGAPLREGLAWCDAVVADFPFVHPVFFAPSARGKRRVLSTHNVEHHMYDERGGWRARRSRERVRRLEVQAARSADLLVACCDADAGFFAAHTTRPPLVVPNGVDVRRLRGLDGHRDATRRQLGLADDVRVFLLTASKWGPNREAFEFLRDFARAERALLAQRRVHLLVVGGVTAEPVREPGFTATGKVERVEPYFAAADAALNPMWSGAGTNVKMCEFLALRLPILTTPFGARGFRLEDGQTAFLFERESFGPVLTAVRRLFDDDPGRLRRVADQAYAQNEAAIDMDVCARGLADALRAPLLRVSPRPFSATA